MKVAKSDLFSKYYKGYSLGTNNQITALISAGLKDDLRSRGYFIVSSSDICATVNDIDRLIPVAIKLRDSLGLFLLRQLKGLYSHDCSIDIGVDRKLEAFKAFKETEHHCRNVNMTFRRYISLDRIDNDRAHTIINLVACKISEIIGEAPAIADLPCSFGPGNNINVKQNTTAPAKLGAPLVCSGPFQKLIPELMNAFPMLGLFHKEKVRVGYGEWSSVPKNSKTDRSIITEPSLMTFVQKGIGRKLRQCLMNFGVNLKDQRINQELARLSSITGEDATIDMKSASDTIALYVVLMLFSKEWFELLYACSTRIVVFKSYRCATRLEKFSSMGNGFTFELESVIFTAIAHVACHLSNQPSRVSVYGDDVILPVGAVTAYEEICECLGFMINKDKSFSDDNKFRESCGADYLYGTDVRPFYKRDVWSPHSVIRFINLLQARMNGTNSKMDGLGTSVDIPSLTGLTITSSRFITALLSFIPFAVPHGPAGFGHGHIHDERWTPSDGDLSFDVKNIPLEFRRRPVQFQLDTELTKTHIGCIISIEQIRDLYFKGSAFSSQQGDLLFQGKYLSAKAVSGFFDSGHSVFRSYYHLGKVIYSCLCGSCSHVGYSYKNGYYEGQFKTIVAKKSGYKSPEFPLQYLDIGRSLFPAYSIDSVIQAEEFNGYEVVDGKLVYFNKGFNPYDRKQVLGLGYPTRSNYTPKLQIVKFAVVT